MSQFHPSVIFSLLVTGQQVVKGSFSMDPDACILDLMLLSSNDASDEKVSAFSRPVGCPGLAWPGKLRVVFEAEG